MTIEQKSREIEQTASFMPYNGRRGIGFEAARLGIIEGLEMAAKVAEELLGYDGPIVGDAIRALIEEQKA